MDKLFFTIWKNKFLRNKIRNEIWRDRVIDISVDYLKNNLKQLDNISKHIRLDIYHKNQVEQYINCKHKHLINEIRFKIDHDRKVQEERDYQFVSLDWNVFVFHHNLEKLSIDLNSTHVRLVDEGVGIPALPDTLVELNIQVPDQYLNFLNGLLNNLPKQLKKLTLPDNFLLTKECRLPESLTDLQYKASCNSAMKLVVPNACKVLKSAQITAVNDQEVLWALEQKWIGNLVIKGTIVDPNLIPNRITNLTFDCKDQTFKAGSLHNDIVSLTLHHNIQLPKGMLPSKLKYLCLVDFNHRQIDEIPFPFPSSLQELVLPKYTTTLKPNVLPNGLKVLDMHAYNNSFQAGHLPNSLQHLLLNSFRETVRPNVLPNGLKTFRAFDPDMERNCLPQSLTSLQLPCYRGKFDKVGCLSNLKELRVHQVDPSIATLIPNNAKEFKLTFTTPQPIANLSNKSIQKLELVCLAMKLINLKKIIDRSLQLPLSLQSLKLTDIEVNVANVIPNGCVYLSTNRPINSVNLPSSLKSIIFK
ncbi:hypothetical protein CYY_004276 [Polysphondylium violaceum]|uniref:FNIP repeat-containing protein n=1 Tax=Polysphondylium violaceum TaxID=133409 RepID=A0A8J4PWG8_9MYCE|nr:hypothetical protein CYY_004276 [Polysphondylium violaceum]